MNDYYVLVKSESIRKNCDELAKWLDEEIGEVEKEWNVSVHDQTLKVLVTFRTEEQKVRFILTWGTDCELQ